MQVIDLHLYLPCHSPQFFQFHRKIPLLESLKLNLHNRATPWGYLTIIITKWPKSGPPLPTCLNLFNFLCTSPPSPHPPSPPLPLCDHSKLSINLPLIPYGIKKLVNPAILLFCNHLLQSPLINATQKMFPLFECSPFSTKYKWYWLSRFQLNNLYYKFRQPAFAFWPIT